MRNLWHRFLLRRVVARWFWSHSSKTPRVCIYSIVARDLQGQIVGMLIVTKYGDGVKVSRR